MYDIKLHLIVTLESTSLKENGVDVHYFNSQVHSNSGMLEKFNHLLEIIINDY